MSDTELDSTRTSEIEDMKNGLKDLADSAAGKFQQISDAAIAFIAALDYGDETLAQSSLVSLLGGLAEVAGRCVAKELRACEDIQTGLRAVWNRYIDKKAYDFTVFEAVKDEIESIIDERIGSMLKLRKFVQSVEKYGQTVESSEGLDNGIRELRRFREEFLKGWPSRRSPAPIDRESVSKAREAIRRGEKGLSKDQLIWRDKRSEKAV